MKIKIEKLGFFFLVLTSLFACNKEQEFTKAISITIKGYNIGDSELEVAIDETAYDKFRLSANQQVDFAKVYTYPAHKSQASLSIKNITLAKEVFRQQLQLNSAELDLFFPFVMINGNVLEVKPPAADPGKNKVAFYIHYPESNDAIDVFLKNEEGHIAYVAKNVKASTWLYVDYLAHEAFKDSTKNYTMYFTKAGTTDTWAFGDSEQLSHTPIEALFLPKFAEKGRVCSYFITPSANQLDAVRLFKGLN